MSGRWAGREEWRPSEAVAGLFNLFSFLPESPYRYLLLTLIEGSCRAEESRVAADARLYWRTPALLDPGPGHCAAGTTDILGEASGDRQACLRGASWGEMFKRSPSVKSLSVLRSSDRKKVLHQIILDFGLAHLDQDAKNSLLPDGTQVWNYRLYCRPSADSCILHRRPSSSLISKSLAFSTLTLKEQIHCGSKSSHAPCSMKPSFQLVHFLTIFAEAQVYTLWNSPLVLRSVCTWDHVLEKLQTGADLMTPGLTSWDPEIRAGDISAITLEDRVPVAVGVAAFDVGHLAQSKGGKGKAIYLVHCYHDELWGLGNKDNPPSLPPNDPTIDPLEVATQNLSLDESEKAIDSQEIKELLAEKPPMEPEEKHIQEASTSGISVHDVSNHRN